MNKTERILLISSLYPPRVIGGAEIIVRNLAEGFAARGHQVCVATLAPRGQAENWVDAGVSVKQFEMRCRYWPFSGIKANRLQKLLWHVADNFDPDFYQHLRRLNEEFAPTIVHSHNINGLTPAVWLSAQRARRVPIIHTCHDYGLLCSRTTMFKCGRTCEPCCRSCKVLTSGKRYFSRFVNGAVGVSRAVLAPHLKRHLFARNCLTGVIYNAQTLDGAAGTRTIAADGRLRLGFMGRLSSEKGIVLLFEELARVDGGFVLQVAGRGDTNLVSGLAARYGVPTSLVGFIAPKVFYENVDILIVPSLWEEPASTVALEAYRHGVPVVVSNRGGLPELVRDGDSGFIFDPDKVGDLARIICTLRDHRALLLAASAATSVASRNFTVERMVSNYLAFYNQVCTRINPAPGERLTS